MYRGFKSQGLGDTQMTPHYSCVCVCVETVMEKHFDRWTNGDILNAIYGHFSHLGEFFFVHVIKLNASAVVLQANINPTLLLIAATSVLFICSSSTVSSTLQ